MNTTEEAKTRYLKNEIAAFEGRLAAVKSEVTSLGRQKETLKGEIEAAKTLHNQEVEKKVLETRASYQVVEESRKKLESDKAEFQHILSLFQKDKAAFEREKQEILDFKAEAKRTFDRVSSFIVTMRNEAQKL